MSFAEVKGRSPEENLAVAVAVTALEAIVTGRIELLPLPWDVGVELVRGLLAGLLEAIPVLIEA